jgi:hypothetical protein
VLPKRVPRVRVRCCKVPTRGITVPVPAVSRVFTVFDNSNRKLKNLFISLYFIYYTTWEGKTVTRQKTLYISGLRTDHLLLFGLPKSPPLSHSSLCISISSLCLSLSRHPTTRSLSLSSSPRARALSLSLSSLSRLSVSLSLSLSLVSLSLSLSLSRFSSLLSLVSRLSSSLVSRVLCLVSRRHRARALFCHH